MKSNTRAHQSKAGAASLTQLPPSPEILSLAHEGPPTFNLGGAAPAISIDDTVSRLRSAANYKAFHPQAIACSPPTFLSDGKSYHQPGEEFSSLGAIAGDNGIALFRTSRPDAPLLVLSHSSMAGNAQTGGIQNLAFEPVLIDSVLLAASRGNGLLIWDASGHSLSPLMGRLAVESTESSQDGEIRSIAWKQAGAQSTVATSTKSYTAIWDLRASLGAKTSKPSLRFGAVQNTSPLIQVACSHKEECATMDSSGFVRVYDLRMTGRTKPSVLTSFPSFNFAGVGLTSFRTSADESYWMASGLDAPKADAVVKIWTVASAANTSMDGVGETDPDTYWHMDGSAERSPIGGSSRCSARATQVAQFTMPYLACARVCPTPFKNSIVTVGLNKNGGSGFRAELWKLIVEDDDASDTTDTFGIEKILSFTEDGASHLSITTNADSLRGAELALSQVPLPLVRGPSDTADEDWELLLCCMSEAGLVTTSVVAEAPTPGIPSSVNTSHPLFASRSLRYFPNERRGTTTFDAASSLKSIGDSTYTRSPLDDTRNVYAQQEAQNVPISPSKVAERVVDVEQFKSTSAQRGDGNTMPFDMDVGLAPLTKEQSAPSTVADIESENIELAMKQSRIVKRVASDRVPCPRLCGATFSAGIGGLVCFNNGDINKMWGWFQKNESRRKSSGLRSTCEKSDGSPKYPRLKKDLDDMTKAAKDAQWGENDEDHLSESNESEDSIDDLFEDLSSDEDGDTPGEQGETDDTTIYETYFGARPKPVAVPKTKKESEDEQFKAQQSAHEKLLEAQERQAAASFDGPSSDVLAPIVLISYDTNKTVFNGQSVELADNLLLGDWISHENFENLDGASNQVEQPLSPTGTTFDRGAIGFWSPTRGAKTPPRPESRTLTQVLSDPMMATSSGIDMPIVRDDDPVHGGEYAIRPRREESLVILRKLLPTPYQSLMSPPDSHMLPNKLELQMKRSNSSNAIMQTARASMVASLDGRLDKPMQHGGAGDKTNFGVFTLPIQNISANRTDPNASLKLICIHNSNVCTDFGEVEKANTWSILAQVVDNHLNGEVDTFNGWGGTSLALDLVSSLLQYYEGEGDIQMVATMVCVLSAGQRNSTNKQRTVSLLSFDQNTKYDLYIQLYAELVYRWGLSSKRVELHKHLSRHLSTTDASQVLVEGSSAVAKSGVSFAISCPRCKSTTTTSDGNICSTCRDFGFRCIMCANAVRGLFTVCSLCGHGGHLDHVMSWFEEETTCPSGCGCNCVFTAPLETSKAPTSLRQGEEEPELLMQRLPYSDMF